MEKHIHSISEFSALSLIKYCAECGVSISNYACNCNDGPEVMKQAILKQWEEYFWMDGSVKLNLINYENFKR